MKFADGLLVVEAPLLGDPERRRWYADGGETCLVLTESGQLLEPAPTFGPSFYRVIASDTAYTEAHDYARERGFHHLRQVGSK